MYMSRVIIVGSAAFIESAGDRMMVADAVTVMPLIL
jgi:hypothetical protein